MPEPVFGPNAERQRGLAKLSRTELQAFKERLARTLKAVREDEFQLPYRFAVPRTSCGFLLVPVHSEHRAIGRDLLTSYSLASKHELDMFKQVGVTAWKSGEFFDIEWLFTEGPNPPNPALDEFLRTNSPFRRTKDEHLPRYLFDTETLRRHGLGEYAGHPTLPPNDALQATKDRA